MSWTESRKKQFIISVLRSGTQRYPPKYKRKEAARTEKKKNEMTGRLAQHYQCEHCHKEFPSSMVEVNHKNSVIDVAAGFVDWNDYIDRLFCEEDGFELLCKTCHAKETKRENEERMFFSKSFHKPTYICWHDMRRRCYDESHNRFQNYGGRGITVCEEWLTSYSSFLKDMGNKPDGYSLDRIDNNLGYSKKNCRWATSKEQANNRTTNALVSYNGETKTVSAWAEELGLTHGALQKRLKEWPLEKALNPKKYNTVKVDHDLREKILELHLVHGVSQAKLAKQYDISQSAISKWKLDKERK